MVVSGSRGVVRNAVEEPAQLVRNRLRIGERFPYLGRVRAAEFGFDLQDKGKVAVDRALREILGKPGGASDPARSHRFVAAEQVRQPQLQSSGRSQLSIALLCCSDVSLRQVLATRFEVPD